MRDTSNTVTNPPSIFVPLRAIDENSGRGSFRKPWQAR